MRYFQRTRQLTHGRVRRFTVVLVGSVAVAYALWWLMVFALTIITPSLQTLDLPVEGQCVPGNWPNRISVMTWNLGYAGNGAEASFFLDGGHDVLAENKPSVLRHMANMTDFLGQHPEDIYLLQEVDSGSRRTFYVNELELIAKRLNNSCFSYARNHDVPFIPYPYLQPLGRVRSGILSAAARRPVEARRYKLPGSFHWPDSAFQLQRCLLVWRLPREDGADWVVINAHLEAWDDGDIRKQELTFLRDLALEEYKRGNYVIIGGDWNSILPGVRTDQFSTKEGPGPNSRPLPDGLFPADWSWGVDTSQPTNRRTNAPYRPGTTSVTVIDGFLVSPNVKIDSVATVPLGFKDTDHEPVIVHVIGSPPFADP